MGGVTAPPDLSRRALLGTVVGLVGGGLVGCTATAPGGRDPGRARPSCVARSSLAEHTDLGGLPLRYEVTGRRSRFAFDPGFYTQLEQWVATLEPTFGSAPTRLSTYGSWTSPGRGEGCGSWHQAGRAFDLAAVRLADGREISARHDRWRDQRGTALREAQRGYWRLAAELHRRFAHVLTYLYDDAHDNHLHVDNGRSGSGLSRFRTASRVQVQAVQAMATHLWDEPVATTGRWDADTRRAVRRVLDRADVGPGLTDPAGWHGFLTASARRA